MAHRTVRQLADAFVLRRVSRSESLKSRQHVNRKLQRVGLPRFIPSAYSKYSISDRDASLSSVVEGSSLWLSQPVVSGIIPSGFHRQDTSRFRYRVTAIPLSLRCLDFPERNILQSKIKRPDHPASLHRVLYQKTSSKSSRVPD